MWKDAGSLLKVPDKHIAQNKNEGLSKFAGVPGCGSGIKLLAVRINKIESNGYNAARTRYSSRLYGWERP